MAYNLEKLIFFEVFVLLIFEQKDLQMKKLTILAMIFIAFFNSAFSQSKYAEVGVGIGSGTFSPVLGFQKDYAFGKKKRILVGTGIRYTGYFGKDKTFTSAPNELAIDLAKTDSLLAPTPAVHALNIPINLGYKFNDKLSVGFTIDVIGVSFGPTRSPSYIVNGRATNVSAKPTPVNVLLVGNNDRGSLNSMFYGKYKITDRLGLKLGYQYLFNELTTSTVVQEKPIANDRFRVKSSLVFIGLNVEF